MIKNIIKASYSKVEFVNDSNELQHPLIREGMKVMGIKTGVEMASIADIPSGTGLGSSSAFCVGMLNALSALKGRHASKEWLADKAAEIEIDVLKDPIGKQDQYAASYGNLNYIRFNRDESVEVRPIICSQGTKKALQDNLMLFYTGITRKAGDILKEQKENSHDKFQTLLKMRDLAEEVRDSLHNNDLTSFGEALHKGWALKKQMASKISNDTINVHYAR